MMLPAWLRQWDKMIQLIVNKPKENMNKRPFNKWDTLPKEHHERERKTICHFTLF